MTAHPHGNYEHPGAHGYERNSSPPVETRPFSYLHRGRDGQPTDNETRPSAAAFDYQETDSNGQVFAVHEIVTSLSETKRMRNLWDIDDYLRKQIAPEVAKDMQGITAEPELTGLCVVESPHAVGVALDDYGQHYEEYKGIAVETSGANTMRYYDILEKRYPSGEIVVEVRKEKKISRIVPSGKENQFIPKSSRITTAVRGRVPLGEGGFVPPQTNVQPYETYLTGAVRSAIDAFHPDRSLKGMPVKGEDVVDRLPFVPADEGRPLGYVPGKEHTPERPSSVLMGESIKMGGRGYNVFELIEGETATKDGLLPYAEIDDRFDKMGNEIIAKTPLEGGLTARCLIEYPHQEGIMVTDAKIIMSDANGMVAYDIQEEFGKEADGPGEVAVTVWRRTAAGGGERTAKRRLLPGRKKARDGEKTKVETLRVPKGSRITYDVRGLIPTNEPAANRRRPAYEIELMRAIRNKIIDFNEAYPDEKDIDLTR